MTLIEIAKILMSDAIEADTVEKLRRLTRAAYDLTTIPIWSHSARRIRLYFWRQALKYRKLGIDWPDNAATYAFRANACIKCIQTLNDYCPRSTTAEQDEADGLDLPGYMK